MGPVRGWVTSLLTCLTGDDHNLHSGGGSKRFHYFQSNKLASRGDGDVPYHVQASLCETGGLLCPLRLAVQHDHSNNGVMMLVLPPHPHGQQVDALNGPTVVYCNESAARALGAALKTEDSLRTNVLRNLELHEPGLLRDLQAHLHRVAESEPASFLTLHLAASKYPLAAGNTPKQSHQACAFTDTLSSLTGTNGHKSKAIQNRALAQLRVMGQQADGMDNWPESGRHWSYAVVEPAMYAPSRSSQLLQPASKHPYNASCKNKHKQAIGSCPGNDTSELHCAMPVVSRVHDGRKTHHRHASAIMTEADGPSCAVEVWPAILVTLKPTSSSSASTADTSSRGPPWSPSWTQRPSAGAMESEGACEGEMHSDAALPPESLVNPSQAAGRHVDTRRQASELQDNGCGKPTSRPRLVDCSGSSFFTSLRERRSVVTGTLQCEARMAARQHQVPPPHLQGAAAAEEEAQLREGMVLAGLTPIITAFEQESGGVLYQNATSAFYFGLRMPHAGQAQAQGQGGPGNGADTRVSQREGAPGAYCVPPLLSELFRLEPTKLDRVLAEVCVEGRVWKGIVQVPTSCHPVLTALITQQTSRSSGAPSTTTNTATTTAATSSMPFADLPAPTHADLAGATMTQQVLRRPFATTSSLFLRTSTLMDGSKTLPRDSLKTDVPTRTSASRVAEPGASATNIGTTANQACKDVCPPPGTAPSMDRMLLEGLLSSGFNANGRGSAAVRLQRGADTHTLQSSNVDVDPLATSTWGLLLDVKESQTYQHPAGSLREPHGTRDVSPGHYLSASSSTRPHIGPSASQPSFPQAFGPITSGPDTCGASNTAAVIAAATTTTTTTTTSRPTTSTTRVRQLLAPGQKQPSNAAENPHPLPLQNPEDHRCACPTPLVPRGAAPYIPPTPAARAAGPTSMRHTQVLLRRNSDLYLSSYTVGAVGFKASPLQESNTPHSSAGCGTGHEISAAGCGDVAGCNDVDPAAKCGAALAVISRTASDGRMLIGNPAATALRTQWPGNDGRVHTSVGVSSCGPPRRCTTQADLHSGSRSGVPRVLAFASSLRHTPSAVQQVLQLAVSGSVSGRTPSSPSTYPSMLVGISELQPGPVTNVAMGLVSDTGGGAGGEGGGAVSTPSLGSGFSYVRGAIGDGHLSSDHQDAKLGTIGVPAGHCDSSAAAGASAPCSGHGGRSIVGGERQGSRLRCGGLLATLLPDAAPAALTSPPAAATAGVTSLMRSQSSANRHAAPTAQPPPGPDLGIADGHASVSLSAPSGPLAAAVSTAGAESNHRGLGRDDGGDDGSILHLEYVLSVNTPAAAASVLGFESRGGPVDGACGTAAASDGGGGGGGRGGSHGIDADGVSGECRGTGDADMLRGGILSASFGGDQDSQHQILTKDLRDYSWHEMTVTRVTDPVTGRYTVILMQVDVTAKVEAERHLVFVTEAEHRLLEQIFPRHVLAYMTEEDGPWAANTCGVGQDPARGASTAPIRDINVLATSHQEVTLLFADIQGFTPMCKALEPRVVMAFLNDLFTRFDQRLDEFGVYKVETIGDCYFVAGGLVGEDEEGMSSVRARKSGADLLHAEKVFAFAKAMLTAASQTSLPGTGGPVRMRIGIHSGPVVSGVVGQRMPRFCLFGDTVNTTARMESTGVPGCIHASEDARRLLSNETSWVPTGGIEVKGKGLMNTHLWTPPEEAAALSLGRCSPKD